MAEAQRTLHIVTEALTIPLGIFLIWCGLTLKTKKWFKTKGQAIAYAKDFMRSH